MCMGMAENGDKNEFFRGYHFLVSTIREPWIGFTIKGIGYSIGLLENLVQAIGEKLLFKEMSHFKLKLNFN